MTREHLDKLGDGLDPLGFARTRLNFDPDPLQAQTLAATEHRGVLLTSRQWGKSTVTAAKAVHQAYCAPESLVLVVSPHIRQSAEFIGKARQFISRLGITPKGQTPHDLSVVLPNRSRIIGLPSVETNIRGFSAPSLVIIDEAAIVPDEVYMTLAPMLATCNGHLWMLSTPRGKSGFFYRTWRDSDPGCFKLRVPATECPRIPQAFLEREKARLTPSWFEQEYLCEFNQPDDSLFDGGQLQAALDDSPPLPLGRTV